MENTCALMSTENKRAPTKSVSLKPHHRLTFDGMTLKTLQNWMKCTYFTMNDY